VLVFAADGGRLAVLEDAIARAEQAAEQEAEAAAGYG